MDLLEDLARDLLLAAPSGVELLEERDARPEIVSGVSVVDRAAVHVTASASGFSRRPLHAGQGSADM